MINPPAYASPNTGDADGNGVPDIYEIGLPAGWEARMANDRVYWVNHATQTSSWDDPRGMGPPIYSAQPVDADLNNNGVPDKYESNLPQGWECRMQGDRPYWINHNDHTSSWDDPRNNLMSVANNGFSAGFGDSTQQADKWGFDEVTKEENPYAMAPMETTANEEPEKKQSWVRQATQIRDDNGALLYRPFIMCFCIIFCMIAAIVTMVVVCEKYGCGSGGSSRRSRRRTSSRSSSSRRSSSRSSSRGRRNLSYRDDWLSEIADWML